MKKVYFNQGTLIFDKNNVYYELPWEKTNIHSLEETLEIIDQFDHGWSFDCTIEKIVDERNIMRFSFDIENGFFPLSHAQLYEKKEDKLYYALQIINIAKYLEENQNINTVFKPINFFVNKEQRKVKVLYRGINKIMPAEGFDEEPIFTQTKRLLLFLLSLTKFDNLLYNGINEANQNVLEENRRIVKRLSNANDFEEMEKVIQLEIQEMEQEKSAPVAPKKEKKTFSNISLGKIGSKKILIAISFLTFVIVVAIYALSSPSPKPQTQSNNKNETKKQEQPAGDNQVVEGLRLAAQQKYKEASKLFDHVNYNNLSRDDKMIILYTYLYSGQAQKAIDKQPDFAGYVVDYLIKSEKTSEIKKLKSDAEIIQFEKAVLDMDKDKILLLKDKIPSHMLDERRKKVIVHSFMLKGDFPGALEFGKKLKDYNLMIYVKEKEKYTIKKSSQSETEKDEKLKKIDQEILELQKLAKGE